MPRFSKAPGLPHLLHVFLHLVHQKTNYAYPCLAFQRNETILQLFEECEQRVFNVLSRYAIPSTNAGVDVFHEITVKSGHIRQLREPSPKGATVHIDRIEANVDLHVFDCRALSDASGEVMWPQARQWML